MSRPSIDEYDMGSYFDGSIAAFEVLKATEDGLSVDPSPDLFADTFDGLYDGTLCRDHAYQRARDLGFVGPLPIALTFQPQPWQRFDVERALVRFVDGHPTHVATYDYGRACFNPGDPRTAPCDECGAETLIDGFVS